MKLSCKLDRLQEATREYAEEPHKLYLIGLLAEHADDAEMTAEFLEWVRNVLSGSERQ